MTKFTADKAKKYADASKKFNDNQEVKIRKGQALNLAVAQAIHEEKTEDTKYVYSLFVKYYEMAALLQSSSIEDIKEAIK